MKLSKIEKANAAIEGGSWIKSPVLPGVRHHVKGMACVEAQELRSKLIAQIPRAERLNGLSKMAEDAIELEILSQVIWLGSEGLTDDDKHPIILDTPEKRVALLDNPDLMLLRSDVRAASMLAGGAELGEAELDAKN